MTSSDHPSATRVRTRTLEIHDAVRDAMRALLQALRDERAGGDDARERVRARTIALAALVRHQVDVEARELGPVLETIDAWGPERLERMQAIHAVESGAAKAATREHDPVAAANALVRVVLACLRKEERELLAPDLLTDEMPIARHSFGG